MMRTIVYWGLYWGPLILGNYQIFLTIQHTIPQIEARPKVCPGRDG